MVDTSSRTGESSTTASRARRWAGVAVVAAAAAGLVVTAIGHRDDFVESMTRVGPATWTASLALGVAASVLAVPVWRSVLGGLGVQWPLLASARLFFVSQLGKYLPGSVWPVLIQMEAATRWRTRRSAVLAAQLLTILTTSCVGLVVGLVLLSTAGGALLSRFWWAAATIPLLVVLLHPPTLLRLANAAAGLLGREGFSSWVTTADMLRAAAWSVPLWLAMGLHAAVVARAMGHDTVQDTVIAVAAVTLAMPAGTLCLPAPAGGGVREVVMVLVLGLSMPTGDALALTVTSRLVLIAADGLLAAVAWTIGRLPTGRPLA